MATKKTITPPPQLVRDKEELKTQIEERIKQGDFLLSLTVTTPSEKDIRWDAFLKWDDLNHEIIASAFDRREHVHEYEYKYRDGFDIRALYGGRREKPFAELIEENRRAIAYQLDKLTAYYNKIDLQHQAPGIQPKPRAKEPDDLAPLLNILNRFHLVALELRSRHSNNEPFEIANEYDVQDLLRALLQLHYEDIRPEEHTPSYAGRASRMDFLLKREKIVVEAKKTRPNLRAKELGDELTIAIAHYRSHPDCKRLVCFVYDPDRLISNPRGVEDDLKRQGTDEMTVEVIIRS